MTERKPSAGIRLVAGLIVAALAALGYVKLGGDDSGGNDGSGSTVTTTPETRGETPEAAKTRGEAAESRTLVVRGPNGPTDLAPTLERIERGEAHPHRNDGAVFQNRERRLPQKPRDHYREYVHPTPGERGPGPQRIVIGGDGDVWYTADHYASFRLVNWSFAGEVPR